MNNIFEKIKLRTTKYYALALYILKPKVHLVFNIQIAKHHVNLSSKVMIKF